MKKSKTPLNSTNPYMQKLLSQELSRKEFLVMSALAVASISGVAGVLKQLISHAETASGSIETEKGNLAGNSSAFADGSASGGHGIMFGKKRGPIPFPADTPQPTVRYSFRSNLEGWQLGAAAVDSATITHSASQRVVLAGDKPDPSGGCLVATMRSTADDTHTTTDGTLAIESDRSLGTAMNWRLTNQAEDDRMQVSIRVNGPATKYTVYLTMCYSSPDNQTLYSVDSVAFAVPANQEHQLDTRLNRGSVPADALTRMQNVKIRVVDSQLKGGTVSLLVNNFQQIAAVSHYGAPSAGIGKAFFSSTPENLPAPAIIDSFTNRNIGLLTGAHTWASRYNRAMHIGEWSWPGEDANTKTNTLTDSQQKFKTLAEMWLRQADRLAIPYTSWGESSYWSGNDNKTTGAQNYGSYPMAHYYTGEYDNNRPRVIDRLKPSGAVYEAHYGVNQAIPPAINLVGMCFVYMKDGSVYSNENHGTVNSDYYPENPKSIDYLYGRGLRQFRVSFRWDRIMKRFDDNALDQTEWGYVKDMIDHILSKSGTSVLVDVHDSASYWNSESDGTVTHLTVDDASGRLTTNHFVNLWNLISDEFVSSAYNDRLMYELTNEPKDGYGGAYAVRRYTQAVVTSLRSRGDDTFIIIPLYPYDNIINAFTETNHPFPWIRDAAGSRRHAYTFHHYMDRTLSGGYLYSYDDEVQNSNSVSSLGTFAQGNGKVSISWGPPKYALTPPSNYQAWLGVISGSTTNWTQITTLPGTTTAYVFQGLDAGTSYYFGITTVFSDSSTGNRTAVKVTVR